MKILIVLVKYDYGNEKRGYTFEYQNVYLPLCDVYGEQNVSIFDFMTELKKSGREKMNNSLRELIFSDKPDFTIFCLFTDEIKYETVSSLKGKTVSIAYFFDDPWRQSFVREWIKYFDFFTTPDYFMSLQYQMEGIKKAIYSPFGFNSSIYKKLDLPKIYDVTFLGGVSPLRKWTINKLKKEGINLKVFGRGWHNNEEWISHEKMVEIFNQSKINLNLSNAISYDLNFLLHSVSSPRAIRQILLLKKHREQVKGRHYEINGCGGFQLSYYVQGLNLAYEIENEIAVFDNIYTLAETIKFYLANEKLRENIATNGLKKSNEKHTAQMYLKNLIDKATEFSKKMS